LPDFKKLCALALLFAAVLSSCGPQKTLIRPVSKKPNPRSIINYIDGVCYDMNQNPAAALLSFQEALLYDSTSADLYLAIGISYLKLGKENAGLLALKQALKLNPNEKEALDVLAEVYLRQNNMKSAADIFSRMLVIDSTNTDAWLGLGMIAQQTRKAEKAKEYYWKCIDVDPKADPRVYDFLGMLYLENGDFSEGKDVYKKSLKSFPDNGLAYNRLGMIDEAQGDTVNAVENYLLSVKYAPGFKDPIGRLNLIYLRQKSWPKARALFVDLIKRDSTDIASWLGLGTAWAASGVPDSAKHVFAQVIERFPDDGRATVNLGEILMEEELWDEAFTVFKKITIQFPDSPEGWLRCGRALFFGNRLKEAEDYFRQTIDRSKDSFLANYFLGSLLLQLKRNLDAVPYLEKSLESVSAPARRMPIIGSLASAYDALGRFEIADSLFQQALAIDPDNSTILNNYGYSLSIRGERFNEALKMALKALEQEPENGSFLDTVGWIHYLMKDYENAANYLEKAWEVRKTSAEVADHLGDVYEKLGKMAAAKEKWQEALNLEPDNETVKAKLFENRK